MNDHRHSDQPTTRLASKIASDHDATLATVGLPSVFVADPAFLTALENGFVSRLGDRKSVV